MRYKLIIFDFDGTLADTLGWFTSTINTVAGRFGIKDVDLADIDSLRKYDAGYLLKKHRVPLWKIPLLANHMRKLMARDITGISLFDNVNNMLQRLNTIGAVLAVVSSNSANNILRVFGGDTASLFRYYECGVSIAGKVPKIKKLLRKTQVKPSETLFIGDEIRDGAAAGKARVDFGAVSWGYNSIEALREQSPSLVFNTVE